MTEILGKTHNISLSRCHPRSLSLMHCFLPLSDQIQLLDTDTVMPYQTQKRVSSAQGKQRKHRDFVCSSTKLPDCKDTGYCDICHDIFKVSFAPEIVADFLNWHGESFQLNREKYREMNRENTGNLKNKNKNKGGGVLFKPSLPVEDLIFGRL